MSRFFFSSRRTFAGGFGLMIDAGTFAFAATGTGVAAAGAGMTFTPSGAPGVGPAASLGEGAGFAGPSI